MLTSTAHNSAYYELAVTWPMCAWGWPENKMVTQINVLTFTWQYHCQRTNASAYKITWNIAYRTCLSLQYK